MKVIKTSVLMFLAFLLVASCNRSGSNNTGSTDEKMNLDEILAAADAIDPSITSVEDVFKTLDLVNAEYYPMLCNDPYNAPNYLTSKPVAAANLGIYTADIVYHKYGDATEDMYLTFSAAQELARYMGLDSEFGATVLVELEAGSVSRDSLILAFNSLMEESKKYASDEEILHVHSAFMAGIFVEKIYISASLLNESQKKTEVDENDIQDYKQLLAILDKQLESLEVLEESVENHADNLSEIINLDEFENLKTAAEELIKASDSLLNSATIEKSDAITNVLKAISDIRDRIVSA